MNRLPMGGVVLGCKRCNRHSVPSKDKKKGKKATYKVEYTYRI